MNLNDTRTLHQALRDNGIVSFPGDDRGRHLWQGNEYLGIHDAKSGWQIVQKLELQH